jgi:hypothetical protein
MITSNHPYLHCLPPSLLPLSPPSISGWHYYLPRTTDQDHRHAWSVRTTHRQITERTTQLLTCDERIFRGGVTCVIYYESGNYRVKPRARSTYSTDPNWLVPCYVNKATYSIWHNPHSLLLYFFNTACFQQADDHPVYSMISYFLYILHQLEKSIWCVCNAFIFCDTLNINHLEPIVELLHAV